MPVPDRTIYTAGEELCKEGHPLTGANGLRLPENPETGETLGWMCRKCRMIAQRSYGTEWKNGRGQIYVFVPDHPMSRKDGFYARARLVMENELGRLLDPDERVLHKAEGQPENDSLENLKLFNSQHELAQYRAEQFQDKKEKVGLWAALTPKQREAMLVKQQEAENNRRLAREEAAEKARLDALRKANERRSAAAAAKKEAKKSSPSRPEPEYSKAATKSPVPKKEKAVKRKVTNSYTSSKRKH